MKKLFIQEVILCTQLSRDEIVERLRREAKRKVDFRGEVTAHGFHLTQCCGYKNSFRAQLDGYIQPTPMGIVVTICFVPMINEVVCKVILGLAGILALALLLVGLLLQTELNGSMAVSAVFPVLFAIFAGMYSWNTRSCIREIQNLIEAELEDVR